MPGKTEVSFKQWYHEVQCVKDHYPESEIRESIMQLLKGAVLYVAIYMGPTASVAHILQKLTVIFGTVASFDILMQDFYKVTQSNHKKVPSFATRLEGTLNQIWLQYPRSIMDSELQQHLKDCLFHGVCKHISNSIWYLYSNPRTTYSQLMITASKAESKNEKAQDKARSAVTTKPVDGTTELANQIAKQMAALTRAGQGNSPGSTPHSPRQRGHRRGQMDRNTPGCPNSHNGQTGLGQTASAHSVSASHGTGTTSQSQGNAQRSKDSQGSTSNRKDNSSHQCFRCQGWGHMAWECATQAKALNQSGGTKGVQPKPPLAPATTVNSRPPAFPPWHWAKTDHTQSDTKERWPDDAPVPFPQSWPCSLSSGML